MSFLLLSLVYTILYCHCDDTIYSLVFPLSFYIYIFFPSPGAASLRHAYNFIQANKVLKIVERIRLLGSQSEQQSAVFSVGQACTASCSYYDSLCRALHCTRRVFVGSLHFFPPPPPSTLLWRFLLDFLKIFISIYWRLFYFSTEIVVSV